METNGEGIFFFFEVQLDKLKSRENKGVKKFTL